MEERLQKINDLVDLIKIDPDREKKEQFAVNEMKKKFPRLNNYYYAKPENIMIGDIIVYVDLYMTKISFTGIVVNIIYTERLNMKNNNTNLY